MNIFIINLIKKYIILNRIKCIFNESNVYNALELSSFHNLPISS